MTARRRRRRGGGGVCNDPVCAPKTPCWLQDLWWASTCKTLARVTCVGAPPTSLSTVTRDTSKPMNTLKQKLARVATTPAPAVARSRPVATPPAAGPRPRAIRVRAGRRRAGRHLRRRDAHARRRLLGHPRGPVVDAAAASARGAATAATAATVMSVAAVIAVVPITTAATPVVPVAAAIPIMPVAATAAAVRELHRRPHVPTAANHGP